MPEHGSTVNPSLFFVVAIGLNLPGMMVFHVFQQENPFSEWNLKWNLQRPSCQVGGWAGSGRLFAQPPEPPNTAWKPVFWREDPGRVTLALPGKKSSEVGHAPPEVLGSRLLEGHTRRLDEHAGKFVNPSGVGLWKKINSVFLPSAWNLDSRLIIELFRCLVMCKLCRWDISMTLGYTRNWPQSLTAEPQLCFCHENLCS